MLLRVCAVAAIIIGFAFTINAQASASSRASATIVTPIGITNTVNMNFGNVAVNNAIAGIVTLSATGDRTASGGVTIPVSAGTITAASFEVTGSAAYTYSITLPTSIIVYNGSFSMTATTFTSNPLPGAGILGSGGKQTLNVGASLIIPAAQPAGLYVAAMPFDVTVNYN